MWRENLNVLSSAGELSDPQAAQPSEKSGEQKTNMLESPLMGRRPYAEKREDVLRREDLNELAKSLSHLSMGDVLDFYQRAYRDCRIINGRTFPPARAVQELVQAWKQLRRWRRS